jgi:TetR/AcrR family transcriptional regulator, transcriptional repressor for nem operon
VLVGPAAQQRIGVHLHQAEVLAVRPAGEVQQVKRVGTDAASLEGGLVASTCKLVDNLVVPDKPQTSTSVVEVARHLLQTRGYSGLRYADVADAVGITRASIHYYFPTKAVLGRAVIATYRAQLIERLAAIDADCSDPREKLDRYVGLYRGVLEEDAEHMCPGGMLAAEFTTLPADVQQEVREFFADNEAWLVGVLSAGRPAGEASAQSVHETARHVVAVLQGALLMARLYGGAEIINAAAARIRATLWPDEEFTLR